MTDQQKIEDLRTALAAMLRVTFDPDPLHPSWASVRGMAADTYQKTS